MSTTYYFYQLETTTTEIETFILKFAKETQNQLSRRWINSRHIVKLYAITDSRDQKTTTLDR